MYDVKKGYLPSPFNALYENTDFDISDQPHIQEVIEEVLGIAEEISGDIDPNYVTFRVKLNDLSFVSSGSWLWKIRTFKNYKKTHKNFKDWCRDAVGKSYKGFRQKKLSHSVVEVRQGSDSWRNMVR